MTERQFERWNKMMVIGRKVFKCHQLSERSFHIKGFQFPICARCTGLFFGFVLIGPIITVFTLGNMFLSLTMILLMCIDGFIQLKGILESTNIRRLITGLLAGYGLFSIIVHIIYNFILLF